MKKCTDFVLPARYCAMSCMKESRFVKGDLEIAKRGTAAERNTIVHFGWVTNPRNSVQVNSNILITAADRNPYIMDNVLNKEFLTIQNMPDATTA